MLVLRKIPRYISTLCPVVVIIAYISLAPVIISATAVQLCHGHLLALALLDIVTTNQTYNTKRSTA